MQSWIKQGNIYLKKGTLFEMLEIEYYRNTGKKTKKLKAFQNIVSIFKINSIDFRFFVFICRASRICSHFLSILCDYSGVFN